MTILLPISAGGYSSTKGWTGGPEDKPPLLPTPSERHHSLFSENESDIGWQTLGEHTSAVDRAADNLTVTLNIPRPIRQVFSHAALWHDVGKAHARWQEPLVSEAPRRDGSLWGKFKGVHFFRPGFRHEALSLLAAWEQRRENIKRRQRSRSTSLHPITEKFARSCAPRGTAMIYSAWSMWMCRLNGRVTCLVPRVSILHARRLQDVEPLTGDSERIRRKSHHGWQLWRSCSDRLGAKISLRRKPYRRASRVISVRLGSHISRPSFALLMHAPPVAISLLDGL